MTFVDTNYFLRFLLADVEAQHVQAKHLFTQGANGETALCTSLVVFLEIYWVLESFYGKRKSELISVLSDILAMRFIEFNERELCVKALNVFASAPISFEDSYNLVYASLLKASDFATFDKKLLKVWKNLGSANYDKIFDSQIETR